jgi:hypothetical protein
MIVAVYVIPGRHHRSGQAFCLVGSDRVGVHAAKRTRYVSSVLAGIQVAAVLRQLEFSDPAIFRSIGRLMSAGPFTPSQRWICYSTARTARTS